LCLRYSGVIVGQPGAPLGTHLRVSLGLAEDNDRMLGALREILMHNP
jgi:histidinol-phosphate/aromatic aminotransferase/cobyric acid decarboxylase-like protein